MHCQRCNKKITDSYYSITINYRGTCLDSQCLRMYLCPQCQYKLRDWLCENKEKN